MDKYFLECIKEAQIAELNGDVPIGSVVVFNNEIISRGHNDRLLSKDVTAHAEVIAIRKAAEKIGDWRLDKCDLYVTLEPCAMCKEIIKESRINKVFYLVRKDDYKHSSDKTEFCCYKNKSFQQNIFDYKDKLSDFFKVNCNR